MRVTFVQKTFLNLKGIYLFALQKDKCQEKVWKKGVEFEKGKKDLSLKGLFPLLKYRPLSGTEHIKKGVVYHGKRNRVIIYYENNFVNRSATA